MVRINTPSDLERRVVDMSAADRGNNHIQEEWIARFNKRKQRMMSAPDLYRAGKSDTQALLASLQRDFQGSYIITSTRIEYEEGLNARIIHNYGSTKVQATEQSVLIPEYLPQSLDDVLKKGFPYFLRMNNGLRFMQVLFGTTDSAQQIKDTLVRLSNFPSENINVWSTAVSDRPTVRVPYFCYFDDEFRIANSSLLCNGSARVVTSTQR